MTQRTISKFYKQVSISEQDRAFVVLLDGKPVKTPGRAVVALPSRQLADAVAQEWREQGEKIDPTAMPLTGLANTAIDHLPAQRDAVVSHIVRFGRSDLLCYRANTPAELVARQSDAWDPLLAWAAETHGASLAVGMGVAFIEQPEAVVLALENEVRSRNDFALAALNLAVSLTGSLVLALALAEGHLGADEAFAAATVDEVFQAEKWGRDAEADARRARVAAELGGAERFLRFLAT
jgi:chaperone required for assembly of F1-ATPase